MTCIGTSLAEAERVDPRPRARPLEMRSQADGDD